MKKLIYFFAAFVIGINVINAKTVGVDAAKTVASNFYMQSSRTSKVNVALAYTETAATGEPVYYVFNFNFN